MILLCSINDNAPKIYEPFKIDDYYCFFGKGNFAVKRQEGRFNCVGSDQTIEQTTNKHKKSHGGIMGYSTTPGTVQRWVLTSHITAHCELELEEGVLANPHSETKDISKSWMNFGKYTLI